MKLFIFYIMLFLFGIPGLWARTCPDGLVPKGVLMCVSPNQLTIDQQQEQLINQQITDARKDDYNYASQRIKDKYDERKDFTDLCRTAVSAVPQLTQLYNVLAGNNSVVTNGYPYNYGYNNGYGYGAPQYMNPYMQNYGGSSYPNFFGSTGSGSGSGSGQGHLH